MDAEHVSTDVKFTEFLNTRELLLYIGTNASLAGCASQDILMVLLHSIENPKNEIADPPADFERWEHERLVNRGLTEELCDGGRADWNSQGCARSVKDKWTTSMG